MVESRSATTLDPQHQAGLQELLRLLRLSAGEFSLVLALCNATTLRQQLIDQLQHLSPDPIQVLSLPADTASLYRAIAQATQHSAPPGLVVTDLESVTDIEHVLEGANQIREEFRTFEFPIILWVTDLGLKQMIRATPDLYSWADTIEFETPPAVYIDFLYRLTREVWQRVLQSRENQFLSRADLGLEPSSRRCLELDLALEALQPRLVTLPIDLQADVAFVQARIAPDPSAVQDHLQASLNLWQSLLASPDSPASALATPAAANGQLSPPAVTQLAQERVGHLQFYLGLWWRNHAVRHRGDTDQALAQAEDLFTQAVNTFEAADQPQFAATYINYLGEALQRQGHWEALQALVPRALKLHGAEGDLLRQARVYGFWAEADLATGATAMAHDHAQQALTLQNQALGALTIPASSDQQALLDWEQAFNRGWYLFSLGKAQAQLGEETLALTTLEQARDAARPDYDPDLYRHILEILRQTYFDRDDYLLAFHTDQAKAAIESRFQYRAFIGAGRIQPQQSVANPALPAAASLEAMAPEIRASGREDDVARLVNRIERKDIRFTVIHGPSGVGKSSIIEGGLMPALGHLRINSRRVLPVLQRVYRVWPQTLNQQFDAALTTLALSTALKVEDPDSDPLAALLAKLRQVAQQQRATVLIFDQFEEFFFDCQHTAQRRQFYNFLQQCLRIPFVNVVVSLREDYLSYVLEGERLIIQPEQNTEDLLDDILKKANREYLGNFSPDAARQVMVGLIQQTPYTPEPALIDQVVTDLAADLGEVRPIELQIVGAQLQAEEITDLATYQALATPVDNSPPLTPKEELVRRYVDRIVTACGPQQDPLARILLYLLTDEQNTRPLKTRADLEQGLTDLGVSWAAATLDLVLEILVGARLIFSIPTQPHHQYQLVHDYLAAFVRRQQEDGLVADLKQAKAEREKTQARFNRFLRMALAGAGVAIVALGGVSLFAFRAAQRATRGEINALASSAQAKLAASQEIEALQEAIELGQLLQQTYGPQVQAENPTALLAVQEVVYGVQESNRLEGFGNTVTAVSFSPDGELMATADARRIIKLWERDGTLLTTLPRQANQVYAVSFSPSGQTLASAGFDGTVRLWSREGELLHTLEDHEDRVYDVRFSPDGQTLASASTDGTVKLWRSDGALIRTLTTEQTGGDPDVNFSPNGQTLIASSNNVLKLWSLEGELLHTLEGHGDGVKSVDFSPDGELIASASDDRTVRLWTTEGELLHTLQGHGGSVRAVSFSPDSDTLASVSEDGTIRLWNREGESMATLRGHKSAVLGVEFSPDGQTLATTSRDNTIKLWRLGAIPKQDLVGHGNRVMSVVVSPDGATLASSSSDWTVRLWQRDGTPEQTLTGHEGTVWEVAFNPFYEATSTDQKPALASASNDGTVKLWSREGEVQATLEGHTGPVYGVSISPDGQMIASASADQTVKLWTRKGEPVHILDGHTSTVNKVRFSPDGQILASASWDQTAKLWSREGELLHTLIGHEDTLYDVAFNPTGAHLASVSFDGTVKLWTLEGDLLHTISTGMGEVRTVQFSPDGEWLALGGDDSTIQIWSQEGRLLKVLRGHEAQIQGLSVSPDGQTLASASSDQRIMLWNLNEWTLELEALLERGCIHLADYLSNNPETLQTLTACHTPALLQKAAPALVSSAKALAQEGEVQAATDQFTLAQQWDNQLEFEPGKRARELANQAKAEQLITEGVQFTNDGDLAASQAAFKAALELMPGGNLSSRTLADLCLHGSLSGLAAEVLSACDRAIELDNRPGLYEGRRGLARALVGDNAGAIADFEAYLAWLQPRDVNPTLKQSLLTSRQKWIDTLKAGENPFTPAELERLQTQWSL